MGIWQQHINLVPLNLNLNHMNFIRHIGVLLLALMSTDTYPQSEQTINGGNVKAANGGKDDQQTPIFWDN